ncbi:hypothetical protein HPB52_004107 [Rhipicephalus sanguineus]|uniref:Uncharacterized protein n=1 Tax=Rhipicephalus sanguineus TaxID=34632 RepID=A0A9D4PG86_RHISA|nr:hypothetical protein HPB52_004107 [Rhipicephalus sanguineus]
MLRHIYNIYTLQTGRVCAENLDEAHKYVYAVMLRLRRDNLVQGVTMADLESPDDDCYAWELHSSTIWGLDRISHDE